MIKTAPSLNEVTIPDCERGERGRRSNERRVAGSEPVKGIAAGSGNWCGAPIGP